MFLWVSREGSSQNFALFQSKKVSYFSKFAVAPSGQIRQKKDKKKNFAKCSPPLEGINRVHDIIRLEIKLPTLSVP